MALITVGTSLNLHPVITLTSELSFGGSAIMDEGHGGDVHFGPVF